jgi:hypothetical protein
MTWADVGSICYTTPSFSTTGACGGTGKHKKKVNRYYTGYYTYACKSDFFFGSDNLTADGTRCIKNAGSSEGWWEYPSTTYTAQVVAAGYWNGWSIS